MWCPPQLPAPAPPCSHHTHALPNYSAFSWRDKFCSAQDLWAILSSAASLLSCSSELARHRNRANVFNWNMWGLFLTRTHARTAETAREGGNKTKIIHEALDGNRNLPYLKLVWQKPENFAVGRNVCTSQSVIVFPPPPPPTPLLSLTEMTFRL